MKTHTISDQQSEQDAYDDMRSDLSTGECARIDSPANGPDRVTYCGKFLGIIDADKYDSRGFRKAPSGVFRNLAHALRAIETAANEAKFWPNVYHINERRHVTLIHPKTGREIASWV